MTFPNLPRYIIQELPNVTESLYYPLRNTQRIKYTCFDVSKTIITFGATSGGIYVFNRSSCEFIQLIPNKDGALTRLAISPDEKNIAYANGRGIIAVTNCNQSVSGNRTAVTSREHQGNEVTAIVWNGKNMVFCSDDVGKISVLQLQNFIAKSMFQSSAQTIMSLDSRICQLDVKESMLLISTLSRSYISDTSQEQYRQIGQKPRDGEFGACFVNKDVNLDNNVRQNIVQDFTEVKQFNVVDDDTSFAIGENLVNTVIYCARPSSRLWEASIHGEVKRTHQFKQVLAKQPIKVVSLESYNNENICIDTVADVTEGRSINFSKLYSVNGAIFSFKKDALYFLNLRNVKDTIWIDAYKDIVECKVYHDIIYLWLADGTMVNLKYMNIDDFLLKCYIDEKYILCAELCALYRNYLLSNTISNNLHILSGLRDKLQIDLLDKVVEVLDKFYSMKTNDATQMKSGIYVIDNTYNTVSSILKDDCISTKHEENMFTSLPPDAFQTIKDLGNTVSDKLNTSKKILREKWDDFEEKVKHIGQENHIQEVSPPRRISTGEILPVEYDPPLMDNDIIYKESSQKAIEVDNNSLEQIKLCKSLYQYYLLSLFDKESEQSNLVAIVDNYACDINQILNIMLLLEQYCVSVGALSESKLVPNNIFLNYLNQSPKKDILLDSIVNDESLYKYFVDSCISVNIKTHKISNQCCDCGYPLPFTRTNDIPIFSDLIDEFIEKQWISQTRDQCYEICKRMPYLWKKILYLRRNEDLHNVLRILLQMLDENLLHSFLPQFTLGTWDRAIQLYATLHANMCLNCNKKFNHVSVKDMLSWDDLGALIIKSVGGKNALKVMEKHADVIEFGELTLKFYHTCLFVAMYEIYDVTITSQLVDSLYDAYNFEECRHEIRQILRNNINGIIRNTALPLVVAANTNHWGLRIIELNNKVNILNSENQLSPDINQEIRHHHIKYYSLTDILSNLKDIANGVTDCVLCGLPLKNEVLIQDGGLWAFKCGHTFHGSCLELSKVKLCPSCLLND